MVGTLQYSIILAVEAAIRTAPVIISHRGRCFSGPTSTRYLLSAGVAGGLAFGPPFGSGFECDQRPAADLHLARERLPLLLHLEVHARGKAVRRRELCD
jgi:hypothetical protein